MRRIEPGTLRWIVGCIVAYLATMGIAAWLLWSARESMLDRLDEPEQRAHWEDWKRQEEARAIEGKAPVERRPPASAEPPTLVLLRDHFPAVVTACLAAGTVLFAFLAFVIRGVMKGAPSPQLLQDKAPGQPADNAPPT